MDVLYGDGRFLEGDKDVTGQIILSEHKLFLKGPEGEHAQTFIPLERIERIKKVSKGVQIYVRPSQTYQYVALIEGASKNIDELIKELVRRRNFKKRFLSKEWFERPN